MPAAVCTAVISIIDEALFSMESSAARGCTKEVLTAREILVARATQQLGSPPIVSLDALAAMDLDARTHVLALSARGCNDDDSGDAGGDNFDSEPDTLVACSEMEMEREAETEAETEQLTLVASTAVALTPPTVAHTVAPAVAPAHALPAAADFGSEPDTSSFMCSGMEMEREAETEAETELPAGSPSFTAMLVALAEAVITAAHTWWSGGQSGGGAAGRGGSYAAPPPPYLVLSTGESVHLFGPPAFSCQQAQLFWCLRSLRASLCALRTVACGSSPMRSASTCPRPSTGTCASTTTLTASALRRTSPHSSCTRCARAATRGLHVL